MFRLAMTPRWLAGLALVLMIATGFMMLSRWQLNASTLGQIKADPAKEKVVEWSEVLKEHEPLTTYEADSMVRVTGEYVPGSTYLVSNKLHGGERGYWVVSELVPDGAPQVVTSSGEKPRGIVVARAWTSQAEIPAEPQGEVQVAGRLVANDAPFSTEQKESRDEYSQRILGSAASAQLTNLWDSPLYGAILTADAEAPQGTELPLTAENEVAAEATVIGQSDSVKPVDASQVTDEDVNWMNIFYALEWVVFAGFALFLWWRMLRDSYEKANDPAQYFEYEGEYWLDEETGRYYYWDPEDQAYYFFDEVTPAR